MNSPAVKPIAPSTHPALELIALAQLSPEEAGQRLRALLLANPKYFGNIPPTSFNAVLKIQEDTTYECLSHVAYDSRLDQIHATVDIKQTVGYSGAARNNGSEEFVRFYLSYDGGAKWLDQGMRSVNVSDGIVPRPLAYEVILQIVSAGRNDSTLPRPKIRAILSWNSPPPAGAPNWTPVWGNVIESETEIKDSRIGFSTRLQASPEMKTPEAALLADRLHAQSELESRRDSKFPSQTDSDRRFLSDFFPRSAQYTLLGIPNPTCKAIDFSLLAFAASGLQIPDNAASGFSAAL